MSRRASFSARVLAASSLRSTWWGRSHAAIDLLDVAPVEFVPVGNQALATFDSRTGATPDRSSGFRSQQMAPPRFGLWPHNPRSPEPGPHRRGRPNVPNGVAHGRARLRDRPTDGTVSGRPHVIEDRLEFSRTPAGRSWPNRGRELLRPTCGRRHLPPWIFRCPESRSPVRAMALSPFTAHVFDPRAHTAQFCTRENGVGSLRSRLFSEPTSGRCRFRLRHPWVSRAVTICRTLPKRAMAFRVRSLGEPRERTRRRLVRWPVSPVPFPVSDERRRPLPKEPRLFSPRFED